MKYFVRSVICGVAMVASSALAGEIGSASVNDVKLGGEVADAFAYSSNLNPQGAAGSSGFDGPFAIYGDGPWEKVAKIKEDNGVLSPMTYQNSFLLGKVSFSFTMTDDKNGTWSMTSLDLANDLMFDLVFAMHVGGGSGAWLFNDQLVGAGQTLQGDWTQNMVNGNNRRTGFSNLTMFARQEPIDPIVDVPEPATLASLALGLGLLGAMRPRKHS